MDFLEEDILEESHRLISFPSKLLLVVMILFALGILLIMVVQGG